MNPNHPHYAGLGGGPNLNLLDNMLMAAGFQATDQPIVPRPALVPQYTYAQVSNAQDVTMHQHALNLGQTQTTVANSDPVHVIVYQQNEHQQQPISYKIPQLGTVVSQEQTFVVNDQGGQISRQETETSDASRTVEPSVQNSQTAPAAARHVQSPAERRKDIVAQAMQEQKIFEENVPKVEPAVVKQEPGVSSTETTAATTTTSSTAADTKPQVTATKSTPTTTTTTTQRRPYQRSSNYNRQQVMPRLTILDDEDDGLTCRLCLASYWYKAEIHEHLKTVHSIADPEKYDKEEKEKKMRRMREEQQRIMLAKKQREERERRLREAKFGRGRGGPGTIKLTSPGARPTQSPGQRPSFQYRDGAFICDLCKESFSDGNDMVTHWKSHVKKQQADAVKAGRGRPRGRGRGRGRGRPSLDDGDDNDSSSEEEEDEGTKKKRGGKGMPRWTAYLLWSTRKRREVVVDHPDWTFAQIAKWISDEWKKIDAGEKDELQKEAEEMNELGIRKLPKDDDGPDPEKDTTDEDSDFEEGYRKKTKPIMLKIKKEKRDADNGNDNSSDESDWEPEAEIMPPEREQTRSGRQRKRPSFFQEFESQENNLDSILEQFEKEQAQEFGKPRQPKPEKLPSEKKPRKPRKRKEVGTPLFHEELEEETLRSGRKRKVRRVMTHFLEGSDEDDKLGRGASSDDDDFEPPPEEDIARIEENDDQIEDDDEEMNSDELEDEEEEDDDRLRHHDMELPPKKRGRPKKLLTDEEIEEATKAAIGTKPVIEIVPIPRVPKENGKGDTKEKSDETPSADSEAAGKDDSDKPAESSSDVPTEVGGDKASTEDDSVQDETTVNEGDLPDSKKTARKSAKTSLQENEGFKVKPPWVKETLSDSEGEGETSVDDAPSEPAPTDNTLPDTGHEENKVTTTEQVLEAEMAEPDPAAAEANPLISTTPTGFVNESEQSLEEAENPLSDIDNAGKEAPVDGDDNMEDSSGPADSNPVPLTSVEEVPAEGEGMELGVSQPGQSAANAPLTAAPPLSEEDLLTGPAHNLDDSQPDIVDPNLDDIFK